MKAKKIEFDRERLRLQLQKDCMFRLQVKSLQLQAEMFRILKMEIPTTTNDNDKSTGMLG